MTLGREESAVFGGSASLEALDAPLENATPSLLYRHHAAAVARWVSHLAGPSADVEDLVHEVFVIAIRRLPEFRGEAKLSTWLYRIARNVVRNHRRAQRVRRWFGAPMPEPAPEPLADGPTPADELERRRNEALVYRVLDGMSEKQRTLLVLFELEERSGAEIAELLGVKVGTVWVQLHRARAEFTRRLQKLEGPR